MTVNSWGSADPAEEGKGGTGTATYTAGDILYSDASNSLAKLAKGTDGEVLTLASGLPSWATSGSGSGTGWTLLSSGTASASSSLDFTSSIDSTYNLYVFVIDNLTVSNDQTDISIRTSSDGGSTWDSGSGDYQYNIIVSASGSSSTSDSSSQMKIYKQVGNASNESANGLVYLFLLRGTE